MAARSQARNWYQPRDLHCALLVASSVVMRSWKSLVGVPHEFAQHWCVKGDSVQRKPWTDKQQPFAWAAAVSKILCLPRLLRDERQ